MDQRATSYDRLGDPGVRDLVADFYGTVRADPQLAPFFASTDMDHLMSMQHEFVKIALGAVPTWPERRMREVHAGRGITEADYARFMELMTAALGRTGLDGHEIDRVVERLAVAFADVLGGSSESG